MRENAQAAIPTIADRQVPASSHRTQAPVPPLFSSLAGDTADSALLASSHGTPPEDAGHAVVCADLGGVALGDNGADGVRSSAATTAEVAAFAIFKMAEDGEPIRLEGSPSLDAAVARVVGLREFFPGEYLIVSEATGERIAFTQHGVMERR